MSDEIARPTPMVAEVMDMIYALAYIGAASDAAVPGALVERRVPVVSERQAMLTCASYLKATGVLTGTKTPHDKRILAEVLCGTDTKTIADTIVPDGALADDHPDHLTNEDPWSVIYDRARGLYESLVNHGGDRT